MSRIDEIKERVERYRSLDQWREDIEGANKNWEHIKKVRQEFEDTGLSDREHLLSRLEIAEKALEKANKPLKALYRAAISSVEKGEKLDATGIFVDDGDFYTAIDEVLLQIRS